MTIGEKIKQARIDKGLTQEELAEKLGYKSRSSVNKIETGGRDIPRSQIKRIAEILDVSPISLLGFEDEKPTDPLTELSSTTSNLYSSSASLCSGRSPAESQSGQMKITRAMLWRIWTSRLISA